MSAPVVIVQFHVTHFIGQYPQAVYALDDQGRLWVQEGGAKWYQIPGPVEP